MKHIITAAAIIAGTGAVASAGQYFLEFQWYTGGEGTSQADLQGFTACIDTDEVNGTVDFTFAFDATGDGVITDFWFESGAMSLGEFLYSTGDGTFNVGTSADGVANPPGQAWDTDDTTNFSAAPPTAHNGVMADQSVTFTFAAGNDFFSSGLDSILNGDARIAFHLQSIRGDLDLSAKFVTTAMIPLPSAGMLACTGLALTAGVRRRR